MLIVSAMVLLAHVVEFCAGESRDHAPHAHHEDEGETHPDHRPPPLVLTRENLTAPTFDAFYIQKLFEKYGQGGKMTFEGFEHLLENLGLGSISFQDHDIHDHKTPGAKFVQLHGEAHHHHEDQNAHDFDEEIQTAGNESETTEQFRHVEGAHVHQIPETIENHHGNHHENQSHHPHTDANESTTTEQARRHQIQNKTLVEESKTLEHDKIQTDSHAEELKAVEHDSHVNGTENRNESPNFVPGSTGRHNQQRKRRHVESKQDEKMNKDHHQKIYHQETKTVVYEAEGVCLSTRSYWLNITNNFKMGISKDMFLHMCPSLIYQIDSSACHRTSTKDRFGHFIRLGEFPIRVREESIPAISWAYGFGAITLISLCGLVGVAIVPLMQKAYYDHVLQFFVALAIGSLSGDAMLHLLPHALSAPRAASGGHAHEDGDLHVIGVGKGLMALAGLYTFFAIERLLPFINGLRARKVGNRRRALNESEAETKEKMILPEDENSFSNSLKKPHGDGHTQGHSHGHSHNHGDPTEPKSISSVAWMVILGDGIHNFSDGMAIGAAFLASTTMGLSTTIAVFCHELPHEIGDFAVLIKTGMTLKQAFFYNILSSVLAMLGMIFGILIAGSFYDTTTWIFAMTAGSFLYISLADLLPELRPIENDADGNDANQKGLKIFLLQCLGIFLGVSIMAIIGIYEEDMKDMFDQKTS